MEDEQRETLAELIELYGITAESTPGQPSSNPNFPNATEYLVTLRREGNGDGDHENNPAPTWARLDGIETPYYMGSALTGEPTALDVLACLLNDAEGYDNATDFEDWANGYGYDTDSRKAEAIYNAIAEQRGELYAWLSSSGRPRGEHYRRFMEAERP